MRATTVLYAALLGISAVNAAPLAQDSGLAEREVETIGATVDPVVEIDNAPAADDTNGKDIEFDDDGVETRDVEDIDFDFDELEARDVNEFDFDDDETESPAHIFARGLKVEYCRNPPKKETCPASTHNKKASYGPPVAVPKHEYTQGQLKVAFAWSAALQASKKQVGARKYPHRYNATRELEFKCGPQRMQFPLLTTGSVYNGTDITKIPDRLVYEYKESKKGKLQVKYCGVMRHVPHDGIHKCSAK